ncbi:hypothetical protein CC2G_006733 [Coprinopsis cinerea AmutBmut pab1-1]|nr:hypothetical protein CC2G_006733 [Coprinopsis cinerea AmutBmut pab1-1]
MSTGYNPPDRLGGHFRAGSLALCPLRYPALPLEGYTKIYKHLWAHMEGYQQANITSPAKGTEEDQTTWVAYYMKGKSEWADQSMVIARVGRVLEYQT